MFLGIIWLDMSQCLDSGLNRRTEQCVASCRRSSLAYLLWEQGVEGSNPFAPTSDLPTRDQFLVGIFVSRDLTDKSALERRLPQIPADNTPFRIRNRVYAFIYRIQSQIVRNQL